MAGDRRRGLILNFKKVDPAACAISSLSSLRLRLLSRNTEIIKIWTYNLTARALREVHETSADNARSPIYIYIPYIQLYGISKLGELLCPAPADNYARLNSGCIFIIPFRLYTDESLVF